jgi:hypothetical protein
MKLISKALQCGMILLSKNNINDIYEIKYHHVVFETKNSIKYALIAKGKVETYNIYICFSKIDGVCIENYYSKVIIRNPKVEKYKQERML